MVYQSAAGSIYLPMCNIQTGEFHLGRLFLWSRSALIFVGTEEKPIKQMIEGKWITQKISFPIFEFLSWDQIAVQIGEMWIVPSEVFD